MTDKAKMIEEWLQGGGKPPKAILGVKLKVRGTLKKFNGDDAFIEGAVPVETLITEDEIIIGGENATAD